MKLNITSNLITNAEYNKELEELIITFIKGGTWKYYGVTFLEIQEFLKASSSGSYFLTKIKPNKRAIKI
jgi:hypothetical protein